MSGYEIRIPSGAAVAAWPTQERNIAECGVIQVRLRRVVDGENVDLRFGLSLEGAIALTKILTTMTDELS